MNADETQVAPLIDAGVAGQGSFSEGTISSWFVELSTAPAVKGTSRAALVREHDALRSALARAGISYRERFAFQSLWNGLSIETSATSAAAVARLSGVASVQPVATISIPRTAQVSPDMAYALAMTGADIAQDALGLDGTGIRVAVMDTGIDYHHPDLGGCFGRGCRVAVGRDFVGDAFDAGGATSRQLTPRPDNDPDDCNGHGTHVAGIIGASGDPLTGGVRGVAPGVTFGAYRVFGCAGSTTADIMIAAMERSLADGMHVLNMSIGSSFQWPSYPTAVAASNLVGAGVVVVASIGNSGANGTYSTGAPGNGDEVIGVASFDNTHIELRTFTVAPAGLTVGYANGSSVPAAPTTGSLPLAKSGTTSSGADACNVSGVSPFTPGQFSGKAVLIRRGTCTFYEKSKNAMDAGAAAVVLYNNVAGRFSPSLAGSPAITIPVVAISDTEGVAMNTAIAAGAQTLTWTAGTGIFANPTGGLISSFSSYGHAPDLSLKPDIGAPGGLIRSTWPLEQGGFATISGTSMSSPHVAGGVALFLEARPGTPANQVRTFLQNSADPKNWWGNPGLGFLDNVHRQGAGMLDIPGAVTAQTRVTPSKVALGERAGGSASPVLIRIHNNSASAVTYDLSHQAALATGGSTFSPSFFTTSATVTFSSPSVTVGPGSFEDFTATITMPAGTDGRQLGGYIRVAVTGGGPTYRVPYGAFRGDYQAISALVATANGFPWLAKRVADTGGSLSDWQKQPTDGSVYTLKHGTDVPWVLFHLDHQVSRLQLDVYNADGTLFGRILDVSNFGRNSAATSFFSVQWDGKAGSPSGPSVKVVKNASYYFKLTVVKALGDPATETQSWTSPTFIVEREIED